MMEKSNSCFPRKTNSSKDETIFSKRVLYSLILIILFAYILNRTEYTSIVETTQGKLQGFISYSRQGRKFNAFWGVPFATPPVGKLRFQSPLATKNWTGVRMADQTGIECIQMDFMITVRILGQEDCLYLNVFTPQDLLLVAEKELLPVIVFIHGGGFMLGSTKMLKPDYFMDEDVVLVTVNYRLGALGFLNTGDGKVAGNMGLKDQTLALRWVKENIRHFGGDLNKVTIMGESAGGASVHMHMMSPSSKGLFHRGISFSGTATSHYALVKDHVAQAKRYGEKFDCNISNINEDFLECLQKVHAKELVRPHLINRMSLSHRLEGFAATVESPLVDSPFLSRAPFEILNSDEYSPVPWMAGVNEGEGFLWYARMIIDHATTKKITKISEWYKSLPILLYSDDQTEESIQEITKYYFNEETDFDPMSKDKTANMTNLWGDWMINLGYHDTIKVHKNNGKMKMNGTGSGSQPLPPLFLYYYTYVGLFDMFKIVASTPLDSFLPAEVHIIYTYVKDFVQTILGFEIQELPVCHGNELAILFNLESIFAIPPTSRHFNFSAEIIRTIADFAGGNSDTMQFHGRQWPPIDTDAKSEVNFMRIDKAETSGLIPMPFAERMRFWENLRK